MLHLTFCQNIETERSYQNLSEKEGSNIQRKNILSTNLAELKTSKRYRVLLHPKPEFINPSFYQKSKLDREEAFFGLDETGTFLF